ncbi:uncharacterized protein TNCV_1451131 [Trichonephila clavipes]|nr:uncharacterized protein TNCV_1451131 [Trichonephila clavipes]
MQSATIAAFFHCCSSREKPMHGQCPIGADSWCAYQLSKATGKQFLEKSAGLSAKILNVVKSEYMKLCDKQLLQKCLHGKTQNANESFNGCLWQIVPKETFIELKTFSLGAYIAVIIFNKGFNDLLKVLNALGINAGYYTLRDYKSFDIIRVSDSKEHSLPRSKSARKKKGPKKAKINKISNCQVIYSQFGLAIHQNDQQARRRFVEWAQNEIAVVPDFHKQILFSDEAHFWLNGYVNKQNCRIWSEANPQAYVETQLHPEKLTVWCALWAGGILLQKR